MFMQGLGIKHDVPLPAAPPVTNLRDEEEEPEPEKTPTKAPTPDPTPTPAAARQVSCRLCNIVASTETLTYLCSCRARVLLQLLLLRPRAQPRH